MSDVDVDLDGRGHDDDDDDDVEGNGTDDFHDNVEVDDEDNWSRQVEVETDGGPMAHAASEGDGRMSMSSSSVIPPAPRREEPTLKEKLVERERQRRVESERARWKRQFAMAAHMEDIGPEGTGTATNVNGVDGFGIGGGAAGGDDGGIPAHLTTRSDVEQHGSDDYNDDSMRTTSQHSQDQLRGETNSVAGTVGEDTVAGRLDTLDEDDDRSRMNYPMERFLRGMVVDDVDQITSNLSKDHPSSRETNHSQGVLMARFLQENVSAPGDIQIDSTNEPLSVPAIDATESRLSSPGHGVNLRGVSFDRGSPMVVNDDQNDDDVDENAIDDNLESSNDGHDLNPTRGLVDVSSGFSSFREDESICQRTNSRDFPLGIMASAPGSVTNVSTVCMPPSEDDQSEPDLIPVRIPPSVAPLDVAEDTEELDGLQGADTVELADFDAAMSTDTSLEPESPSQPRVVLRLTEAEIQEMAAIDEASRSNAPPSERDDISELGELVSDFGGPVILEGIGTASNLSQGTPPTEAMESASSIANHSGVAMGNMAGSDHDGGPEDHHLTGPIGNASVSSQVVASSVAGDESIAGNPPSERHEDDEHLPDGQIGSPTPLTPVPREIVPSQSPPLHLSSASHDVHMPDLTVPVSIGTDREEEIIVNRQIRPGMVNRNIARAPGSPLKKSTSFPDYDSSQLEHIDDFDFDRHNPPQSMADDINNMFQRDEQWSTGLSPLPPIRSEADIPFNSSSSIPILHDYGSVNRETNRAVPPRSLSAKAEKPSDVADATKNDGREWSPLLENGVPAFVATRRRSAMNSFTSIRSLADVHSLAESVFSDIRSESTETRRSVSDDAENYWKSSILQRAFPERLFALIVTLLFEIPVLLMVSGGSDRLCYLIGRTKYQLLIGFLPLSSAISGNVGLQSSTLTTRAISHGHVKVQNYSKWLAKEVGAATYLGLGMGALLGSIAYIASGFSFPFGLTVMTAQFISILTAGITGTFAPLIFTFIFERDSGKWVRMRSRLIVCGMC